MATLNVPASTALAAGQAAGSFAVSVDLMPAGSNVGCRMGAGAASVNLACTNGAGGTLYGVAGGMFEIVKDATYRGASLLQFGEYSSRVVSAGRWEYIEMTVSW